MVTPDPAAAKQRMEDDLDAAEEWGERRRSGEIRDPGCDSVAALLAVTDGPNLSRLSLSRQAAAFYEILDAQTAVQRRAE